MIRRHSSDGAAMSDDLRVFVQPFASAPRIIIFGAIDFSAALAPLAHELGYDVTICDARKPFLESSRFSRAANVVNDWSDRYLAAQVLGRRDAILGEIVARRARRSGAPLTETSGTIRSRNPVPVS